MSELHRFLFEGLPVRGMLVRLTDAWQEVLARRQQAGGYPPAVAELLGQMTAAAALLQANVAFSGTLLLQIQGDGPVKLAVAEVNADWTLRATAKVVGTVAEGPLRQPETRLRTAAVADEAAQPVNLSDLLNVNGQGRCAITLDPKDRAPGQRPYQGIVALHDAAHRPLQTLAEVIEHHMAQSEQLQTRLVLAANAEVAAGLLVQRVPLLGQANLAGSNVQATEAERQRADEDFNRIALLTASLSPQELLALSPHEVLHRLFWQEELRVFEPLAGAQGPRFACTCSRERVADMLRSLGEAEVQALLAEQGRVQVGCEFCGAQHVFDAVDAAQLFTAAVALPPTAAGAQ